MPDELDGAVAKVSAQVLKGAQYDAFILRYFGNDLDPSDRLRMLRAYALGRSRDEYEVTFEIIVRNSNRAIERLFDKLHKVGGTDHRKTILQGWMDAQTNAQRRHG